MILDTRGREQSVEEMIEELKKEIAAAGAEVQGVDNLGRRDFARVTDAKLTAANYVEFTVTGPIGIATMLHERFRLNPLVYRLLVQKC